MNGRCLSAVSILPKYSQTRKANHHHHSPYSHTSSVLSERIFDLLIPPAPFSRCFELLGVICFLALHALSVWSSDAKVPSFPIRMNRVVCYLAKGVLAGYVN